MLNEAVLRRRILDLSYSHHLSHIGSCLSCIPILIEIHEQNPERFVLSNGHAGLALYVVLEALQLGNAESMLCDMGIHPVRSPRFPDVHVSTGSLGQGITVAVGMALAGKETYCLISDGECAEGSVWEALAFKHKRHLDNLHIHVNCNGYSALDTVDVLYLTHRLKAFDPSITIHYTSPGLPFLHGVSGHYHKLTQGEFQSI